MKARREGDAGAPILSSGAHPPPSHNIADRPFGRGSRAIIAAPGSEPTKAVLFTQLRRGNVLGTPVYAGSRTNSADNSATRGLSRGCSRTSRYLWPSFASLPLDRRGRFTLAPSK